MAEPRRRRRRQPGDEAAVREAAGVVAEHPGREAIVRHDQAPVGRRFDKLRVADRRERQVPDGAASLPSLEAGLVQYALWSCTRVESLERLEPADARQAVAELAPVLRVPEVGEQTPRVVVGETERAKPAEWIVAQETSGSDLTIEPRSRAPMSSAIARSAWALSESGAAATSGSPASPHSRSNGSSGTRPSRGTPSSAARRAPPPGPNKTPGLVSVTPVKRNPRFL